MANVTDIAWLAGLMEGDGCFTTNGQIPVISVAMLDKDVIERVAKIFQAKIDSYKTPKGDKICYRAKTARRAIIEPILLAVYPYMGQRRKERIMKLLNMYYTSPKEGVSSQT